jgi:hypothetical protein
MMMGAFLRIIQKLVHSFRPVGRSENPEKQVVIQGKKNFDQKVFDHIIPKNGGGVEVAT